MKKHSSQEIRIKKLKRKRSFPDPESNGTPTRRKDGSVCRIHSTPDLRIVIELHIDAEDGMEPAELIIDI